MTAVAPLDRDSLVDDLHALTGGLQPAAGASAAELHEVRRLVAREILRGRRAALTATPPYEDSSTYAPRWDTAEIDALRHIADAVGAELGKGAGDDERLFRRTQPVLTPQLPDSVPPWACGWAVERTLGPFVGEGGRSYWFDVRRIAPQIQLVGEFGLVLAVIPHPGALTPSMTYSLPAGTIWVRSSLIAAASSPEGAFTGLLIKSGDLKLSAPANVDGGSIALGFGVHFDLNLQLQTPTIPSSPATGPGGDARACRVSLPQSVRLRGTDSGSGSITHAANGSLSAYGTTAALTFANATAAFDAGVNRILVPYDTTSTTFNVAAVGSKLFQPGAHAPVFGGFWALPTAIPTGAPTELGPAEGIGGLSLGLQQGLSAEWAGLNARLAQLGPPAFLGQCLLIVEPATLTVTGPTVDARRARASVQLWTERNTPRRSSIDLTFESPLLGIFVSNAAPSPAELLQLQDVTVTGHLDRPVAADGHRVTLQSGLATIAYSELPSETTVYMSAPMTLAENAAAPPPTTIALRNLFLKTTPAQELVVVGSATPSGTDLALDRGVVVVRFGALMAIPMLPDPYVANFDFRATGGRITAGAANQSLAPRPDIAVVVNWTKPSDATTQVTRRTSPTTSQANRVALGVAARPATAIQSAAAATLTRIRESKPPDPHTSRAELHDQLEQVTTSGSEFFRLLDVSSNADQFGVALADRRDDLETPTRVLAAKVSEPTIKGLELVAPANTVRVLTLPPFQWEPVHNIPNPNAAPFPPVLVSDTDGGPTRIGINSVHLVPVAPLPAVAEVVNYFSADNPKAAVALSTPLPFGMFALAKLRKSDVLGFISPSVSLNQPNFPSAAVKGGLQLAFIAGGMFPKPPNTKSRSFAGYTVQTANAHDSSNPGFVTSVLGVQVETIFNAEFSSTGSAPQVPVYRIDLSGYGASLFNDWRDPTAEIAATSEVRFDVTVGRTSYEVVQVKSIVYPWGFHVVRTITLQRTGGGGVFRRDSGWIATSDGVYDFTYRKGGATIDPGIVVHPGVVKALRMIRNIRDTTQIYTKTYPPGDPHNSNPDPTKPWTVGVAAVRFDTDVEVENAHAGANNAGRVPARDIVGYVQLQPSGVPLTPGQLDDLTAAQGAAGGQIDCVFTVGASPLQMRTSTFAANRTATAGGSPQIAVAMRGTVILPRAGQWSFTYRLRDEIEPHGLSPDAAIPLIRQNPVGGAAQAYLFADPADLFQPATPAAEYGIVQSTDTQRLLVRAPKIEPGQAAITSAHSFLLADVYALAGGVAVFPRLDLCIPLPANCNLQVPAAAHLRLVIPAQPGVPANSFPVTIPAERVVTNANSSLTVHVVYADETAAKTIVTWVIDSAATPDWSFSMGPVSVVGDLGAFPGLMRVVGTLSAASGAAAQLVKPRLLFGGALSPVQDVINFLTAIGLPIALSFALTSTTKKIQTGALLNIPPIKRNPDTGKVEEGAFETGGGKLKGELKTGFGNASESRDKLFVSFDHWRLYFEVSGDFQIEILPPKLLYAGGAFKIAIEGHVNEPTEITIMAGAIISIGGDLITKVAKLEGSVRYGYVFQIQGSQVGFGIDIELTATASVLEGLAAVEVSTEAMALPRRVNDDTVHVQAKLTFAVEVTLGWVFNESFEVEGDYEKNLSMPLFEAATILPSP